MLEFQNRLKTIRQEKGYTQQQIAIELNTTQEQYNRYETMKRELPLHHAIKLSYFYNISMDKLFKENYKYE